MRAFLSILAAGGPADWLVYGAAGVVVVYMVLRPLAKKRKKDPLEEMPRLGMGLSQQRAVERDMQNLLVELSDMARQISAQLDTRAAKLDALLQEADGKIAELRRLQEETTHLRPVPGAGYAADRALQNEPAGERIPAERVPTDRVQSDQLPSERSATETTTVRYGAAASESKHQDIYTLADAGRSPQEIAVALDRPRGEVELILALRPR